MSIPATKLNQFPIYNTTTSSAAPETAINNSMSHSRRSSGDAYIGAGAAPGTPGQQQPGSAKASVLIGSKPTLISVSPMRFLIMDAPRQSNLHLYIKECRRHSVTDVVRVCEPTYLAGELEAAGIELHEMAYQDGTSPPRDVLDRWLALVDETFYQKAKGKGSGAAGGSSPESGASDGTDASSSNPAASASASAAATAASSNPTIAVHCVAGLGRAPVLVAIALVEFANMDPVEAVTLIRKHRRGAINEKQLNYLEQYRRSYKRSGGGDGSCCVIL